MTDLLEQVDWSAVECLNHHPSHGLENALKQGYREDSGLTLKSDTDEQLLIHIPFNTAVKISKILFSNAHSTDQAPRHVKLFINRPTIGFSEAADLPGDLSVELTKENLAGAAVQLKVVKFQRINTLTIFVEDNQGDEETTVIEKIRIFGSAGDTFNVSDIKDVSKQEG